VVRHARVHEGAVLEALRSGGRLRSRLIDDGDLCVIDGPGDDLPVGEGPFVDGVVVGGAGERLSDGRSIQLYLGGVSVEITVVPETVDIFDRVRGVFETDVLRDREVAILGVGSGGSFIALELAKAGVGRFTLIDHDRVEVGNVSRHACGLRDVGRLKVNAIAEMIADRNPSARVNALPLRIDGGSFGDVLAACDRADLVICATDNRESRLLANRIGVLTGKVVMFGAVFRRAYGGQVLRVVPGLTPCYQCFIDSLPTPFEDQEINDAAAAAAIAYSDRPVAVEPGLSSDVLPVALMMVKLAILDLLRGRPSTLDSLRADLVAPLLLWINRRERGTDYARMSPMEDGIDGMSVLRWYGVALPRHTGCPACGADDREASAEDLAFFGG
jgi:molybdopterin/thiamine biosynthesis adenylyltransferase